MGFTPEPTRIRLNFAGTALEGLEVVMGSVSIAEYEQMMAPIETREEAAKSNTWVMELFAARVISWNLEIPAGQPVPKTLDGVQGLESNLFTQLLSAWQTGLVSAPPPLPRPSLNGSSLSDGEESALQLGSVSENLPN